MKSIRLTLLQINETVNVGSTGRIASQLGEIALLFGWNSIIAYGRDGLEYKSKTIKIGTRISILLHVALTRLFDRHGLGSVIATKVFVRKIKRLRPEIIHLHNIHGYYLNYELLFDCLASIDTKVVWTLHDCWAFTGHCSFFESLGCNKWKKECNHCPLINDYPKSLFWDRSRKNYVQKKRAFTSPQNVTIIAVSEWLGNLIKQSFLGSYPVKVIHNGIDISVFKPSKGKLKVQYGISDNKIIVLGVASVWHERKGLNDFIRLSEDRSLQVILVGVSERIKRNLPNCIITISRTSNQEQLAALYSEADVFVNPTYDDNFPTTNIEALACGTPVITYRTGGSPEAIDFETGWVVEKGNIERIQEIIHDYVRLSEKEIGEVRRKCRERAVKYFNKQERFHDYFSTYCELLGSDLRD